jgi:hypothetical protein
VSHSACCSTTFADPGDIRIADVLERSVDRFHSPEIETKMGERTLVPTPWASVTRSKRSIDLGIDFGVSDGYRNDNVVTDCHSPDFPEMPL